MSSSYRESPRRKVLSCVPSTEFKYWYVSFLSCGHGVVDRNIRGHRHCRMCRLVDLDNLTEEERVA